MYEQPPEQFLSPDLSIFLPLYNEEIGIGRSLHDFTLLLSSLPGIRF
jgi:hypothetical protein